MSAIDNVTQEDSAVSASAVSISAWDARKAQSFIGEGQERRYEAMKKPIAEDESSEESQVTEIPDDESETAMSAVSTRTVTSCRYRGRGRGRVMKSDRDDLPGTGLGRGGFSRGVIRAGIGRGRARPDDVVSVIEGDLSRVSLATKNESKVENGRGRSETEEVGPPDVNNRRPHVTGVKKENNTFTYNFDNIADLEFPRTVIDPRIQNVETCSMMGQLDSDDNEEGSKMFEQDDSEAGPSPQPAITRAESVCSLRDNFQYEESIDDYCESVSKVDISPQREPEKHQSLMPSRRRKTPPASPVVPKFGQNLIPRRVNRVPVVRRKIDNGPTESRQEKINFYKKKAESSRITEEEGEKEFHRPQSSAFRRSDYDSRDFTPLPTVQFRGGPIESKEEPPKEVKAVKREVEIVEPTVDTFRGFAHENDYQSEGREPRLLPAYQHLLNEYEKIVSIVIHVETKREERSLMNKSPHIDKVQRSIEAFKWRLYEEQQTFYQAPTVDYGPVIDLKEFKYEQTSEKRERQFPTEKVISVDVEKVLRDSQVRFQLKFKDVGEINIFFFRKSIDESELILFEAYPSHNFTGKTQFGMEIIPNKKYRDSKKKAKQFVFGNEMTNAMPMREIYIDSKFNKYFFDHNSTFTANIYVIGFEVYVSPCVRVVQLLQESQKQFRRGVKDYIDFINCPRDVHDDLVAVGDDSSDSEEFSSSS